ncbi:MAG: L-2-hydroxyglutarate oxidase [Elusimicrobia bacterium]|nr:L-2-hydroxyglutarate oxidase [Elusimicrobiota bacterium]
MSADAAETYDALIIGAGVVGCALARSLASVSPDWKIAVLEKEDNVARHTSGRNSEVVHAGFNQKPGTLKARLCVLGNQALRAFAEKHSVPFKTTGTVVTARDQKEEAVLEELLRRGQANGVPGLELIDKKRLVELEPNALGLAALHAPSGAIVDSVQFVQKMAAEAREKGVRFAFFNKVIAIEETSDNGYRVVVQSNALRSTLYALRLINCAGLYADKIAHFTDAGKNYTIVPFRGEYLRLVPEKSGIINSMVYPAPDLEYPFLGIHWTKKIDGSVAVGPNAVMAFGRESYRLGDFRFQESLEMFTDPAVLKMFFQPEFLRLAWRQIRFSAFRSEFLKEASGLVRGCRLTDLAAGKAGNRAQLVDRQGKLVDDVVVETKGRSVHVLNAVSPGMTSSLPFAGHLAEIVIKL